MKPKRPAFSVALYDVVEAQAPQIIVQRRWIGRAGPSSGGGGGELPKTYATWSPTDKAVGCTLSNSNLTATGNENGGVRSTIGKFSGKWYWEIITNGSRSPISGIATAAHSLTYPGKQSSGAGYYAPFGLVFVNDTTVATYASWGAGDVAGFALDMDAGTLTLYKNNTLQGTPVTGLTGTYFAMTGGDTGGSTSNTTANFGATPLAYTPPTGFNAGLYTQ